MATKPTKRKMRRFDEGGYTEDSEALADENYGDGTTREERLAMVRSPRAKAEVDPMEAANASDDAKAIMDEAKGESILKRMRDAAAAPKRAAMPTARPKPAPAMGGSRNTRTGPTADELASYAASRKAAPAKTGVDAIPTEGYRKVEGGEKVDSTELGRNINAMLMGRGPTGLRQLGALGAEAATAGRVQRAYNAAQAERRAAEGMSPAEALAARASQAAPKAAKAEKSVPTKGREEVTNPMMWAAGPKNAGAFKTAGKGPRKIKKALDESDTTGGAVGYKKGGNVRGWGIARGARKAKIV
jgi:hypothetical protein